MVKMRFLVIFLILVEIFICVPNLILLLEYRGLRKNLDKLLDLEADYCKGYMSKGIVNKLSDLNKSISSFSVEGTRSIIFEIRDIKGLNKLIRDNLEVLGGVS